MRVLLTFSLLAGLSLPLAGCGVFDLVSYPFKTAPTSGQEAPANTTPASHGHENVQVEDLPPPQ